MKTKRILVGLVFLGLSPVMAGESWLPRESVRLWQDIASSDDGNRLVAVVSGGQIYTSQDSGTNWTPRDSNRDWVAVASSADGTHLVAAATSGSKGGVFTSSDAGVTWLQRSTIMSAVTDVACSSDGTKLVVSRSGYPLLTSSDGGTNWTARETARSWSCVASSGNGTMLTACVYGDRIFASTNAGVTWGSFPVTGTWFSVACSLSGSRVVAGDRFGTAGTFSGPIWTASVSSRFGVWTWTPHQVGEWEAVAYASDGTRLAACYYDDHVYTSDDHGATWTPHETHRQWRSVAISADGTKLAACVWNGQIYTGIVPGLPPSLTIRRGSADTVVVSWPYPSNGYSLTQTHSLSATGWQAVTDAPAQ
ncbi:MAG: hypothetical protein NTY19_03165, partial [Planctomycetota bacterium]|nr:hypothetical protein [Planctomycetota bacterium]